MARGQVESIEITNGFQGGLNTEAGPLAFPPNCSIEELNFKIEKDGSRRKRKGMRVLPEDQESWELDLTDTIDPFTQDSVLKSINWINAGYSGINIWVVQSGNILYFRNNSTNSPAGVAADLGQITIPSAPESGANFSYAVVLGMLIVAYEATTVAAITFDSSTLSFSLENISLKTRDLWGVYDGFLNNTRPGFLTAAHWYNLRNQGWPVSAMAFQTIEGANPVYKDVMFWWNKANGNYPAHSDLYPSFIAQAAEDNECIGTFNPWLGKSLYFGSTEPSRGQYIIDVFNRGSSRAAATGINGLPEDITYGGISVVGSYAGRVFYSFSVTGTAGTDQSSPNLATTIFFSKVIRNKGDLGSCYSQNDPTSPEINDILATDGGFISIPEIGKIVAMPSIGQSLFIIAENGVWEVNGGEQGFSATNLNLVKTTTVGAVSGSSVVAAEGMIFYWGRGGIYAISIDPVSMRGSVQNLTENSIRQFYLDIPATVKLYVTGIFLPEERQVRWLYSDGTTHGPYLFDRELVFDMNFNAFVVNKFSGAEDNYGNSSYVFGYLAPSLILVDTLDVQVVADDEDVLVVLDEVIIPENVLITSSTEPVRYASVRRYQQFPSYSIPTICVSACVSNTFWDWVEPNLDANDFDYYAYEAYMLTGAFTGGDSQKGKQTVYLTVHMGLTDRLVVVEDEPEIIG